MRSLALFPIGVRLRLWRLATKAEAGAALRGTDEEPTVGELGLFAVVILGAWRGSTVGRGRTHQDKYYELFRGNGEKKVGGEPAGGSTSSDNGAGADPYAGSGWEDHPLR